jgi:hypothetical protein
VLHLACKTEDGFDVTEVWDSREQADVFNVTVMPVAMERSGIGIEGPEPGCVTGSSVGVAWHGR